MNDVTFVTCAAHQGVSIRTGSLQKTNRPTYRSWRKWYDLRGVSGTAEHANIAIIEPAINGSPAGIAQQLVELAQIARPFRTLLGAYEEILEHEPILTGLEHRTATKTR